MLQDKNRRTQEEIEARVTTFRPEINPASKLIADHKLLYAIETLEPANFYKPCFAKLPTAAEVAAMNAPPARPTLKDDPKFQKLQMKKLELDGVNNSREIGTFALKTSISED